MFLTWRLMYNVFLGLVLQAQSRNRVFEGIYNRVMKNPESTAAKLFRHLEWRGLKDRSTAPSKFPVPFRAWLVFRHFVDIILVNDAWCYVLLGIKCLELPDVLTVGTVLQYAAGAFLIAFNYWAKVDAHRCIGDYSWYWGDFFFLRKADLTFDGIFELFPHPMYTVGYAGHYGFALICRSYEMLFATLAAHLLQLAFLVLIEEPHIQRIYGVDKPNLNESAQKTLYDPESGLFPGRKHAVFLLHLDLLRSGDMSLVLFALYGVLSIVYFSLTACIIQVIVWRLIHWLGLGTVLFLQGNFGTFSRHFTERGRTLHEAFGHWRRMYNLSSTMNVIVFTGCAIRFIPFEDISSTLSAGHAASVAGGLALIALSAWSSYSTYSAIGDFGWFYGDFFIPNTKFQSTLVYTGVYRFLNNPDSIVSYAGLYGLALMSRSWTIFMLAAFSQILNLVFLYVVEKPHMSRLYQQSVRAKAPLSEKIKEKIISALPNPVKQNQDNLRSKARRIQRQALGKMLNIYKKLAETRFEDNPLADKELGKTIVEQRKVTTLSVPQRIRAGRTLTIKFSTTPDHSDKDWIGLYPVDVDVAPAMSRGRWARVPAGATGTVTFNPDMIPSAAGVMEARYCVQNKYVAIASVPFTVDGTVVHSDDESEWDAKEL
jgi:phosphatidylethanolamine N-methyltransferase